MTILWCGRVTMTEKHRDIKSQEKYNLLPDFIKVIMWEIEDKEIVLPIHLNGFTRLTITNAQGT